MTCAKCRFVVEIGSNNLFCQRHPPFIVKGDESGVQTTMFPSVKPGWWCGEFSRRWWGKPDVV